MSKQHYQVSTYKAQDSVGYLLKRAHSLMLAVIEPMLEERGFSFIQYVILAWLRDGIAARCQSGTDGSPRKPEQLPDRGCERSGSDHRAYAESVHRLFEKSIHVCFIRHICLHSDAVSPRGIDTRDKFFCRGGLSRVVHDHGKSIVR